MLVIRLFLVGKKNQPFFKIVVIDKRRPPRGGRFVEELGNYNPLTKEKVLKGERIKYWLSVGAKPSASIYNLLVSEKIIEGRKIPVHKKAKVKEATSAPAGAAASQGEKPVEEKPKEEAPKKEKKEETPKEEKKEKLPKTK